MARSRIILALLVVGLFVLAACGGSSDTKKSASKSNEAILPDYARNAPPRVKEAYLYAVSNPEELSKYPCYCGCGNMGHTSNLSCFIQDIAPDGSITFDNHAVGCGICVDIAQDVQHMKADGKTSPEIRTYIDAQYSSFGPGTNTAFPTE